MGWWAPNLKSLCLCMGHLLRGGGTLHGMSPSAIDCSGQRIFVSLIASAPLTVTDAAVSALCAGLPTCKSLHVLELTSHHYVNYQFLPKDLTQSQHAQSVHALSTLLAHTPSSVKHLGLDIGSARTFPFALLLLPQLAHVTSVAFPAWTDAEDRKVALSEMETEGVRFGGRCEFSFGVSVEQSCDECVW